jgi:transcription antitermination factor NusG
MLMGMMTTKGKWPGKNADVTSGIRTGTPVQVCEGPFCGAVGSIVERKPNRLALVQIDFDGRTMFVEVDPRHIDVLN